MKRDPRFEKLAPKDRLGDQPIMEKHREEMNELAAILDIYFNGTTRGPSRKTGFILMVFPFGDLEESHPRVNYISNGADRKDVVTLMREMIARFEGQPEISGTA